MNKKKTNRVGLGGTDFNENSFKNLPNKKKNYLYKFYDPWSNKEVKWRNLCTISHTRE